MGGECVRTTPFMESADVISNDTLDGLEAILHYSFQQRLLLVEALTHSSYSHEKSIPLKKERSLPHSPHNERLEFLGDAVIGLVVAAVLMEKVPEADEGRLSRWRSGLVSRKALADISMRLGLGDYLRLGRGEQRTGGAEKRSILAAESA